MKERGHNLLALASGTFWPSRQALCYCKLTDLFWSNLTVLESPFLDFFLEPTFSLPCPVAVCGWRGRQELCSRVSSGLRTNQPTFLPPSSHHPTILDTTKWARSNVKVHFFNQSCAFAKFASFNDFGHYKVRNFKINLFKKKLLFVIQFELSWTQEAS